jgi:DNA excision repair protein ERCC-8
MLSHRAEKDVTTNVITHKRSRNYSSIFKCVLRREYGLCQQDTFSNKINCHFDTKGLLQDPEIVSPHRTSINSLSMEHNSGRFLLSGSADGTVSIFDVSKWGSGDPKQNQQNTTKHSPLYFPVARSIMVPFQENILRTPGGHSSSITYTQWYPTDAGVFLSGSSDSTLLVWDTHHMKPVLRIHPFGTPENEDYVAATWLSAELRNSGASEHHTLLVAGSYRHAQLKLVDIRSGASSHQLVGHVAGVACVQWSPNNGHILASGSRDGCLRLWDVRKSGSRSCIAVLNRNHHGKTKHNSNPGNWSLDYSHLRQDQYKSRHVYDTCSNRLSKRRHLDSVAPNSYDHLQQQAAELSHHGRVAALKFWGAGRYLCSVGGKDGEMLLWDLSTGEMMPNKYMAPGLLQAAAPNQKHVALLTTSSRMNSQNDDSTSIWVARKEQILGFTAQAGMPQQMLKGHLSQVTALERMEPGGKILSGGADGMILCWGKEPPLAGRGRIMTVHQEDQDNW